MRPGTVGDLTPDPGAVGQSECQPVLLRVVVGVDELQRAAAPILVVDEAIALVDEEEPAVTAETVFAEFGLVDLLHCQRLDRRQRDPRDARGHPANVSWLVYGPRPVITAAPALAARCRASGSESPRARPKQSAAENESPAPYVSTIGPAGSTAS